MPSGVGFNRPPAARSNSGKPTLSSSLAIWPDTAGCVMPINCAAAVTDRLSTTARKASRSLTSIGYKHSLLPLHSVNTPPYAKFRPTFLRGDERHRNCLCSAHGEHTHHRGGERQQEIRRT